MDVSDSSTGSPPPPRPPTGTPGPDAGDGTNALQLTLRVGEFAIDSRVSAREGEILPDAPIPLTARKVPGGWVVEGPDGARRLGARDSLAIKQGEIEVHLSPVRQSRFSRFHLEQGDVVLPVIMLATTVLVLQIGLLWQALAPEPGGAAGWEPTPEYIARLLEGQYDGKERGVIAPAAPRRQGGEAIESYYLQPGHDGPRDRIGGGKNVGDAVRDGDADGAEAKREAEAPPVGGEEPKVVEPVPAAEDPGDEVAEEADGEAEEERPIAVHVDEGWGLTDWYDTEDARKDAEEIQRQLELARDVLKLNPDDPNGLSIRAYYEYLAFDFEAAKRTYERFTQLYPEEPAGWNNLALVYKRGGEYQKEEELYRIALGLSPDDDHALNNLAVCLAHQGRFDEALQIMEKLEVLTPDDAYADLHRAKIYAAMGKEDRAYRFLQKSLASMRKLDTLHNIEFRQDIRVDPAFEVMREQDRFRKLLDRFYGERAEGWWNKRKGR